MTAHDCSERCTICGECELATGEEACSALCRHGNCRYCGDNTEDAVGYCCDGCRVEDNSCPACGDLHCAAAPYCMLLQGDIE